MASKRTRRRNRERERLGVLKGVPIGLKGVPAYSEITVEGDRSELLCRKCGKRMDAKDNFSQRKGSKTGYQYECKACRNEIKKKRRGERREEVRKSISEERPGESRKRAGSKAGGREPHRKELLKNAGAKIAEGVMISDTARKLTFDMSLIFEQQLRLFCGAQVTSAISRPRAYKIVDDALFEVKEALRRLNSRMRTLAKSEMSNVRLGVSLESLREQADARALLGVDACSTKEEIKKAYKNLASESHPDHNGHKDEMQRINKAFSLLMEEIDE